MRQSVLVLGVLLAAAFFFGETLSSDTGLFAESQARVQARSGDCDKDCDGTPDKDRIQERLQDGSCQTAVLLEGDSDCTQDQKHDQVKLHDMNGSDDGTQMRKGRA